MGSRQNRERAIRLRELEIENATLRLGATAEARIQAEEQMAERLVAWIRDPERKPSYIAFTEGPLRQVAVWVEDALHRVSAGDIGAAILKEREECAKVADAEAEEQRLQGDSMERVPLDKWHSPQAKAAVVASHAHCEHAAMDIAAAIRARKP